MSQVLACRNKPRFKLAGMKRLRKKMLGLSEPGTEVALITGNAGKNWSLVIRSFWRLLRLMLRLQGVAAGCIAAGADWQL